VVYGRRVEGQTLTLGVSGKLWRNSLVMFDRETGTLWSQITGEAVEGPLKGKRLEKLAVASRETTFEDWVTAFPRAQVLLQGGRPHSPHDSYADYHSSDRTGVRPTERSDRRLPPKTVVLGIDVDGGSYALPIEHLPLDQERRIDLGRGRHVRVRRTTLGTEVLDAETPPGFEYLQLYWFVWSDFRPGTKLLGSQAIR